MFKRNLICSVLLKCFFSGFISFSYGESPKCFKDVGYQLRDNGFSGGEGDFNEIVFRINDKDIDVLDKFLVNSSADEERLNRKIPSVHEGELFNVVEVYIEGLKTIYHDKTISDKERKVFDTIVYSMDSHVVNRIRSVTIGLYKDSSCSQDELGWHQDWWAGREKGENPEILAFAVLRLDRDLKDVVYQNSKLALGYIWAKNRASYLANAIYCKSLIDSIKFNDGLGDVVKEESLISKVLDNNIVAHILELDNKTGTGYIINQNIIRNKYFIVHSRYNRYYRADRLSMVVRCYLNSPPLLWGEQFP